MEARGVPRCWEPCSHPAAQSVMEAGTGTFPNDTKTCNSLTSAIQHLLGLARVQPRRRKQPSGEVEQKLGSCDFLFIKYLGDDVTGRTFMDILQLGSHKTEVITFCSLRKADCIS